MNYHAHVPAGIAFSAGLCFITSTPLSIPMLIAGAFGGALPDIDHPSGSGAVTSMGEKAGRMAGKIAGRRTSIVSEALVGLGMGFDAVFLRPLTMSWLWLAKHAFEPFYFALYRAFGKSIGWSGDDPSDHRGGLTHSLAFMAFTSLIVYPLAHFLLHDDLVWMGLEMGILSHLFADSLCKSGIKWFWPWVPRIGFSDATHPKGDGIRLLPVSKCVSTGKCPTREDYLELGRGTPKFREMRSYYFREKGWQWFFKAAAVILCLLCVLGIGPGAGSFAWGQGVVNVAGKASREDAEARQVAEGVTRGGTDAVETTADKTGGSDHGTGDGNEAAANATAADASDDEGRKVLTVAEAKGPTSFTYGDLDASELPKGIMKLPDESLYVVGVGPVTADSLNSPTLSLTQAEKDRLLAAATAQRVKDLPSDVQALAGNAAGTVSDAANAAGNAASNAASAGSSVTGQLSDAINQSYSGGGTYGSNGFTDFLGGLFGGSSSGSGEGGFMGLTPFTPRRDTSAGK